MLDKGMKCNILNKRRNVSDISIIKIEIKD